MLPKEKILEQLDIYEKHVKEYDEKFRQKNILPKNHDWRSYRWCSRDIVFALMTVRQQRFRNCLEVDVCMMANPPQYRENIGARVALNFLLSEAYKCGTSMEIVFTENVESRMVDGVKKGRVPAYIYDLACEMGVSLKHVLEGHLTPFESRQMYMELVGFSKEAKKRVMELSVDGVLTPERACFVVMGGIWSLAEAEMIILGNDDPVSLLLSTSIPEDRHLYLKDMMMARGAILGGVLDRRLLKKELVEDGEIVESEDEENAVDISFDSELFAKVFRFEERTAVPWTERDDLWVEPGNLMVVLTRARSSAEIEELYQSDLKSMEVAIEKYKTENPDVRLGYLVPRDFEDIPEDIRKEIVSQFEKIGSFVMMSPESVASLDKESIRRIETGRMVRHE